MIDVDLVGHMGNDLTVVNAARVSFGKQKESLSRQDEKLIAYLAEHEHWTPFSHPQVTFRIKAPFFVARQLFKHKVGLTENEVSRRYVSDSPELYWPKAWRGAPENKKQGSTGVYNNRYKHDIELVLSNLLDYYDMLIADGCCPEQARMLLPMNTMTEWFWSGSLAAFARVVKLRTSTDAQEETREVAFMIEKYLRDLYPISSKELLK